MPAKIEETLLVLEAFKDPLSGVEYRPGDRVQLRNRGVRGVALKHPDWFAVEYASEPVDPAWLREIDERFEAEYVEAKRSRSERKARAERALRDELKHQDVRQPDLERRFKTQEKERERREKERLERAEREQIEAEAAFAAAYASTGFHYQ